MSFFSKDKFNILDLLSLIIILIGLFKDNIIYIFIGTYIQIAQRIQYILKNIGIQKTQSIFYNRLIYIFMITLIFIKNIFSICT